MPRDTARETIGQELRRRIPSGLLTLTLVLAAGLGASLLTVIARSTFGW